MFNKRADIKFKEQLASIICDAQLCGVECKAIMTALKDAIEDLKDPLANKTPWSPPKPPAPKKFTGLAAVIRGLTK